METGAESVYILAALGVYVAIIIGLGVYYARRTDTTEDFILAGHSLSTPFVCGSVVATWLGGAVVIGGATEAYVGGLKSTSREWQWCGGEFGGGGGRDSL